MCIVFNSSSYHPSDTLIVVTPVVTPPGRPQQWQLLYLNSIDNNASTPPSFASFLSPKSDDDTNGNTRPKHAAPPLMVFAIPNPHDLKEHEFLLYPVDPSSARVLRKSVETLLDSYSHVESHWAPRPSTATFGAQSQQAPPPLLTVHTVGGYSVCIAPSLDDLKSRAPWHRFSLSNRDFDRTLLDIDTRYGASPMAFVIAEGISGHNNTRAGDTNGISLNDQYISNAGFAVGYSDASAQPVFFPTSHEPPEPLFSPERSLRAGASNIGNNDHQHHQHQVFPTVNMDVTLVAINAIIRPLSIMPEDRYSGGVKPLRGNLRGDRNVVLRVDDTFSICSEPRAIMEREPPLGQSNGFGVYDSSFFVGSTTDTALALLRPKWSGPLADLFRALPRCPTATTSAAANNLMNKNSQQMSPTLTQLEQPRLVTLWRMKTHLPNGDVTGRKATDMDVQVSNRMFQDVDAWLRMKVNTSPSTSTLSTVPNAYNHNFFNPAISSLVDPNRSLQAGWLQQLDTTLALLARQLADPGICDRYSDGVRPTSGALHPTYKNPSPQCGPVAYVNLDLPDIDLNEEAYIAKEQWARKVRNGAIDTTGSTYVRISTILGPLESLAQRTVQPPAFQLGSGQVQQPLQNEQVQNPFRKTADLFAGSRN